MGLVGLFVLALLFLLCCRLASIVVFAGFVGTFIVVMLVFVCGFVICGFWCCCLGVVFVG